MQPSEADRHRQLMFLLLLATTSPFSVPTVLAACLPCWHTCLPARLPDSLNACLPASPPACLPPCPPSLPPSLPAGPHPAVRGHPAAAAGAGQQARPQSPQRPGHFRWRQTRRAAQPRAPGGCGHRCCTAAGRGCCCWLRWWKWCQWWRRQQQCVAAGGAVRAEQGGEVRASPRVGVVAAGQT